MEIGRAIKELRIERNISQNKLSKLAKLNRGYLYKLENDQISPSIAMLERIADSMRIKVSDITKKAEGF